MYQFPSSEEKLRELEEKYCQLFHSAKDAVFLFTLDSAGKIVSANQIATKLLGILDDEFLNKHFVDIVGDRSREKVLHHWNMAKKGEPQNFQLSIVNVHGNQYEFNVTHIPIVVDGENVGVYVVAKDITHSKRTEEALRIAQQELKETVRHQQSLDHAQQVAKMGSWDVNLLKSKLYWSDQMYRILGVTPREWSPSHDKLLSFVHPDDQQFVSEIMEKTLEGKTHNIEFRIIREEGAVRWVHSQSAIIEDESGQTTHVAGTVQDITERKLTEELLRKSERLSVALQLAEGVTHEIRNPLTSLKGFLQLIRTEEMKEQYFDIMSSEIDRIESVIDEFLMLAKPQAVNFKETDS